MHKCIQVSLIEKIEQTSKLYYVRIDSQQLIFKLFILRAREKPGSHFYVFVYKRNVRVKIV